MVRVHVEVLHPEAMGLREEGQRVDRLPRLRLRVVGALRVGDAARDLLARERAEILRVHARHDRVADLGVVERALDAIRLADLLVLRQQVDRAVRLVPRRPHAHLRERGVPDPERGVLLPRRRDPEPAIALGRGVREVLEVLEVRRRVVARLAAVRPRGREDDREDDLDVVRLRVLHEPVVERPVVGVVARVVRIGRAARVRDGPLRAAPVEVDAEHLRLQRLQRRERRRRVAVQGVGLVVDPDQ
jgi:hypothetical protein